MPRKQASSKRAKQRFLHTVQREEGPHEKPQHIPRIGIVGSRHFPDLSLIKEYMRHIHRNATVVSGCATNPADDHNKSNRVDIEVRRLCGEFKLKYEGYPPDLNGLGKDSAQYNYAQRFHARNEQLAASGLTKLIAFTEKDKGGTWDTIRRAKKHGVKVEVVRPTTEKVKDFTRPGRPAKQPYHLKQANYGSVALHLQRHFTTIEWLAFIDLKDHHALDCAAYMQSDFIAFFTQYRESLGHIDLLTQAPRSIRNLHKPHCMDYLCKSLSRHLGIPYVPMFAPWDKPRRGIREHPDIVLLPDLTDQTGKVIYVLDDVSTTGETLKRSITALHGIGAHAHGLCFVRWA